MPILCVMLMTLIMDLSPTCKALHLRIYQRQTTCFQPSGIIKFGKSTKLYLHFSHL